MNEETNKSEGLALAGFILGLCATILWLIPLLGLPISIVGLVLSVKGKKSVKNRDLAVAALPLNIVFLIYTSLNLIAGIWLASVFG